MLWARAILSASNCGSCRLARMYFWMRRMNFAASFCRPCRALKLMVQRHPNYIHDRRAEPRRCTFLDRITQFNALSHDAGGKPTQHRIVSNLPCGHVGCIRTTIHHQRIRNCYDGDSAVAPALDLPGVRLMIQEQAVTSQQRFTLAPEQNLPSPTKLISPARCPWCTYARLQNSRWCRRCWRRYARSGQPRRWHNS
jgi:hypothetical protein